ncbi:MAG: hypothetical protein M0P74_07235 [Syntrophales bacterium]|jgi:hypothetical protein|nr:hypothetical protein [Syntrophales bacterium]
MDVTINTGINLVNLQHTFPNNVSGTISLDIEFQVNFETSAIVNLVLTVDNGKVTKSTSVLKP